MGVFSDEFNSVFQGGGESKSGDFHAIGVVSGDANDDGSLNVKMNANADVVTKCVALESCTAADGDRVLVLVMKNGHAYVVGKIG